MVVPVADKTQCNFSHKDDEVVDEAVRAKIEYDNGESPSEWIRRKKREELLELDELPLELAERLATELESEAESSQEEAATLRDRADELEAAAEEKRQRAEELLELGDEDVSLDTETDDDTEVTLRERMVDQMARRAEDGEEIILQTDADVQDIVRDEEVDPDPEWLGELCTEIEQASDVDAHDLDIKINAFGL